MATFSSVITETLDLAPVGTLCSRTGVVSWQPSRWKQQPHSALIGLCEAGTDHAGSLRMLQAPLCDLGTGEDGQ